MLDPEGQKGFSVSIQLCELLAMYFVTDVCNSTIRAAFLDQATRTIAKVFHRARPMTPSRGAVHRRPLDPAEFCWKSTVAAICELLTGFHHGYRGLWPNKEFNP